MKRLQKTFIPIATAALLVVTQTPLAMALSSEQNQVFRDGIHYFNTEVDTTCTTSSSSTVLTGTSNTAKAFNYFIAKGLSDFQAAGIVGNLMWESGIGLPTDSQEGGGSASSPTPNVGFGIAQWTSPGRQQGLVDFAKQQNQPVTSLAVQLDYLWGELNKNYSSTLTKLHATSTIDDATQTFMDGFEHPNAKFAYFDKRLAYAKDALSTYGGSSTGTTAVTANTGSTTSCGGPGQNTQYVDGFTVYSQVDPTWKDNPYGDSTIGIAGCGPSAMAMIISTLTGNRITPAETTVYADAHGQYDNGSKWTIAPVLAEHYGLKAEALNTNDISTINQALQAGKLIITSGEGAVPFTSIGHYIVIRGVTADGKWKVGDSIHPSANTADWDPTPIAKNLNIGSIYAISK